MPTNERGDLLAEQGAVFVGVAPRFHFLAAVVAFYAVGRRFAGRFGCRAEAVEGGLQFVLRQCEVGHALRGGAVEAVGVFDEGGVAAPLYVGADVGDDAFGFGVLRGFKGEQGLEFGLEGGGAGVEFFHGVVPWADLVWVWRTCFQTAFAVFEAV